MLLSFQQIKSLAFLFQGIDVRIQPDKGSSILVTTIEEKPVVWRIMHDGFSVEIIPAKIS